MPNLQFGVRYALLSIALWIPQVVRESARK